MTRTRHPGAEPFLPSKRGVRALRAAVRDCRGCDLYRAAGQAVFGAGPRDAELMLVGEQPGDVEDRTGNPFTGPAGRVLDRALNELGLDRDRLYLTNAVKHFRFRARGKRRIHQRPTLGQTVACRPWLDAELEAVQPAGIVLLGSLAGQSLLGSDYRVGDHRGRLLELPGVDAWVVATVHPSAALRADDREAVHAGLVDDLRLAADRLARS